MIPDSLRLDFWVDISFGVLLGLALLSIALSGNWLPGLTFGWGILLAYGVHIVWRMARFEPKQDIADTVEDVEEKVEGVEERVEEVKESVERVENGEQKHSK